MPSLVFASRVLVAKAAAEEAKKAAAEKAKAKAAKKAKKNKED